MGATGVDATRRAYIANVYHPSVGDVVGGYKLAGQLDVISAEADLWIAEQNGQEFVCKIYRHGVASSLASSGALLALDHPHLLPTKANGEHLGRQYEIAPFCSGGNLEKHLAGGGKLSLADAETLLGQMAAALSYLHAHGIQHRDIKPANILLRKINPLDAVMSDFGRSEESSATQLTMSRATLLYSAPEAVNGMFSPASDWWSVGMVLLESIMGRHPLSELPSRQQHYAIVAGRIEIPESFPARWQQLLRGLLVGDHTQRWTEEQVNWWLQQSVEGSPATLDRKRFPSPLILVVVGLPLIVILTRFLGPIVEEFLGILMLLWVISLLGVLVRKVVKGSWRS